MPPESRENVRLPQPVAGEARTEGEKGDSDGQSRTHFVTPHVISANAATGPSALNASQTD